MLECIITKLQHYERSHEEHSNQKDGFFSIITRTREHKSRKLEFFNYNKKNFDLDLDIDDDMEEGLVAFTHIAAKILGVRI